MPATATARSTTTPRHIAYPTVAGVIRSYPEQRLFNA